MNYTCDMNHMYKTVEVNHVPITWQSSDHELSLYIELSICSHTLHGSSTSHTFYIVQFYIFTVSRNILNGFENNFSGKIYLDKLWKIVVHDI